MRSLIYCGERPCTTLKVVSGNFILVCGSQAASVTVLAVGYMTEFTFIENESSGSCSKLSP